VHDNGKNIASKTGINEHVLLYVLNWQWPWYQKNESFHSVPSSCPVWTVLDTYFCVTKSTCDKWLLSFSSVSSVRTV